MELFRCVAGLRCGGLFRLSAGNPKLVERLRLSFDRTGEADLEAAGDPQSVASLLKLWLRELPEPIILGDVAEEILDIQESELGSSGFFISKFANDSYKTDRSLTKLSFSYIIFYYRTSI